MADFFESLRSSEDRNKKRIVPSRNIPTEALSSDGFPTFMSASGIPPTPPALTTVTGLPERFKAPPGSNINLSSSPKGSDVLTTGGDKFIPPRTGTVTPGRDSRFTTFQPGFENERFEPSQFGDVTAAAFVPPLPENPTEQDIINWNLQLVDNVLNLLGPGVKRSISEPTAVFKPPAFTSLPQEALAPKVNLLDELKDINAAATRQLTESTFQRPDFIDTPEFRGGEFIPSPEFTGSEFIGTQAITPDVINNPAFKAFQDELRVATDENTRRIVEEMARRGVLSSGSTQEAFDKLNEANARAIASTAGNIASPLLQQSTLQQAINEPIRQTKFEETEALQRLLAGERSATRETGFRERAARDELANLLKAAERRTLFGERQEVLEAAGRDKALENLLALGTEATGAERAFEQSKASLALQDFFRARDAEREAALLPLQNQATEDARLNQLLGAINSLVTGQQPQITSALGSLGTIQNRLQLQSQAERDAVTAANREQGRSLEALLGLGVSALGTKPVQEGIGAVADAIASLFRSPEPTAIIV
jgi:hypothetical protein